MSAKFEVLLPGVIVRVAASSPERVKQFYPEAVQVEPLPDHAEIDHKLEEASRRASGRSRSALD